MRIYRRIDTYLSLPGEVFWQKRLRVLVKCEIQDRFDSEELSEVIKGQGLKEDALLKDAWDAACKWELDQKPPQIRVRHEHQISDTVCLMSYKA
jgi:hypothetical protein